jgi:hypothetical protein
MMLNRRAFLVTPLAFPLFAANPPLLIDSHVHVRKHRPANGVSRTVISQVIHYK